MRRTARERHLETRHRRRRGPRVHIVETRRMRHHRDRHSVERPALQHQHLPAARLLRRRPQQHHPYPQHLGGGRQPDRRARTRRTDHVVPTRVPEPRQRVVLRAHPHRQIAAPVRADHRGLQPVRAPFHREPGARQQLREPRRRGVLLERQLRLRVQRPPELQQPPRELPDPGLHERTSTVTDSGDRHSQLQRGKRTRPRPQLAPNPRAPSSPTAAP